MDTYDCVIVGGGPASLSAAIYLARYNRSVVVADHGRGRSTSHEINENYLGFPHGIASRELRELGRRQAERFGACVVECKIEEVRRDGDTFIATSDNAELHGRTLILATGVQDWLPDFDNESAHDYFGKSLFWCITCDGHKVRNKRVAVVGNDDACAATAMQFLNFTDDLLVITNVPEGKCELSEKRRAYLNDAKIPIIEGPIGDIEGDEGMMRAVDVGGGRVELDFMFSLQGARPNSLLGQRLGVATDESGYITVDNEQHTNIPRLYAAGDVTKEFAHQVVTATHEGATAATTANYDLYRPEQKES